MKDFLFMIIKFLPKYLEDFFSLVTGPKNFIATLPQEENQDEFKKAGIEALTFLGISMIIGQMLLANLLLKMDLGNFWTYIANHAAITVVLALLFAMVIRLAWKFVGGRSTLWETFIVYSYGLGVMTVFGSVVGLFLSGFLQVFDQELFQKLYSPNPKDVADSLTTQIHTMSKTLMVYNAVPGEFLIMRLLVSETIPDNVIAT